MDDWGYNCEMVERLCLDYEAYLESVSYDDLVDQLKNYCETNQTAIARQFASS